MLNAPRGLDHPREIVELRPRPRCFKASFRSRTGKARTKEQSQRFAWESTFAVLTGEPNEVMQPIHNRLTTVLEPRDYAEYLALSERSPVHLLRILPSNELHAIRLEKPTPKSRAKPKANPQISLFGSE